MISPYKIKWLDKTSFDMKCLTELSFDGDSGDLETHLNREAIVSESYNGSLQRAHNYKWEDPLTFSVTFIKQDFSDFTEDENRQMLKWLTGNPNAAFVDIYKDKNKPDDISWCALGNWISVSQYKMGNGRIVGYIAEFEALTPWAFSPLKRISSNLLVNSNVKTTFTNYYKEYSTIVDLKPSTTYTIVTCAEFTNTGTNPKLSVYVNNGYDIMAAVMRTTDKKEITTHTFTTPSEMRDDYKNKIHFFNTPNNTYVSTTIYWCALYEGVIDDSILTHSEDGNFILKIDTDEPQTPIYPKITVQQIGNTSFSITNITKSITTKVNNNINGEIITLDGANRVISTDKSIGRIFGDDFEHWTWLPLFDGENEIIAENCVATFEWREPRKIGEL